MKMKSRFKEEKEDVRTVRCDDECSLSIFRSFNRSAVNRIGSGWIELTFNAAMG